jgi:dCTP deaminase
MSVLSESKILTKMYSHEFSKTPLALENIQPSSIDLTLDEVIQIPKADLKIHPPYPNTQELHSYFTQGVIGNGYTLKPNQFILAQIKENINLSDTLVGQIQNRNSLIRLGINVGLSSYINPGYKGKLPIAIHNIGSFEFELTSGMLICQLILSETEGVLSDYSVRAGAKYQGEQNITLSKLSEDKEFNPSAKTLPISQKLLDFLKSPKNNSSQEFFKALTTEQKKQIGLL